MKSSFEGGSVNTTTTFSSQWTSQKHRLKEMYEIEVREACHIIDDTEKDRIEADLRVRHAEQELTQLKDRYVKNKKHISAAIESEIFDLVFLDLRH